MWEVWLIRGRRPQGEVDTDANSGLLFVLCLSVADSHRDGPFFPPQIGFTFSTSHK